MNFITDYKLIQEIQEHSKCEGPSAEDRRGSITKYLPRDNGISLKVLSQLCPVSVLNASILRRLDLTEVIIGIFKKVYSRNCYALGERTSGKWLSPLHIAVISGNESAVQQLIDAGAPIDGQDRFGWAPIHHAALLGHKVILSLLLERGADKKIETNRKMTYQAIQELVYPSACSTDKLIRLFWKNEEGDCLRLTRGSYQEKTSAEFLEEHKVTQAQVFKTWSALESEVESFPFIANLKQSYEVYLQNPLMHVLTAVTQNSSGATLSCLSGLGVFANEDISVGQVLGEHFLIAAGDKKYSNEIAQVNDGFCNTVLVSLQNEGEPFTRHVLVATDLIKTGEQLCRNYDFGHQVKRSPYVELRPKEVRDFINDNDLNYVMECYGKQRSNTCSFEEFCLAEKLRYLLNTPSVLFSLTLEEVLTIEQSKLLQEEFIAICSENNTSVESGFVSLTSIAKDCLSMRGDLSDCDYPKVASFYMGYVMGLSEKKGILDVLDEIQKVNNFLTGALNNNKTLSDQDFLDQLKEKINNV